MFRIPMSYLYFLSMIFMFYNPFSIALVILPFIILLCYEDALFFLDFKYFCPTLLGVSFLLIILLCLLRRSHATLSLSFSSVWNVNNNNWFLSVFFAGWWFNESNLHSYGICIDFKPQSPSDPGTSRQSPSIILWKLPVMFKDALSGLRKFLTTENLLKMMENAFCFILKALFFLEIFNFFFLEFWSCWKNGSIRKIKLTS